ncbi:hypothetical protein AJ80_07337 [Polytolypa hystricis UAMH7299]|uniref:P-loop containing nucleoside triphosphate hydrolase protein n=1 Tax=Polytolypa hystricis (strain UAMH7299) TaxID=1447883 RepID=A0A2B7XGP6_POLH7|nr:hypothetical protein AJ80_07337 [Polytolypa hystricis UAMH7299]
MDEPTPVSIVILGDSGCGKSMFLARLSIGQDGCATRIQASPGDARQEPAAPSAVAPALPVLRDLDQPFTYNVRLYQKHYKLEFYDTAYPHENWTLLRPDLVILAFDITSREGLGRLKKWRHDITRHYQSPRYAASAAGEKIPILMLGLKRDLRVENDSTIYPQESYRIAQELRCDRYAECSALTGELIPEVFEDIARLAARSTTEAGGQTEGGCVVM